MDEQVCNPYRQMEILQQALASDKSRIAFLMGAGCPVSISIQDGDKDSPLIEDIEGLTNTICNNLKEENIDKIITRISLPEGKNVTIEDILSHVRLLIEVVGNGQIDGFSKTDLEKLERNICEEISKAVSKEMPDNETPYHSLASWIRDIQRNHPVEIFTPNYDLLIESALESKNIPYFDGFIGTRKAFFDLHSIEHEELPPRWVRLWKLHGSINWWNDSNGHVFRGPMESPGNKQMIYPSHLKYEQSRRMPYYAMQDRLGHFLATGQAVLITCGYSFVDEHLNGIILERLSTNPRAICFGLIYGELDDYPEAINFAKKISNLSLIARNGAFIGRRKMNWSTKEHYTISHYDYCMEREMKDGGEDISIRCKIGDFKILGHFLFNQTRDTYDKESDESAE